MPRGTREHFGRSDHFTYRALTLYGSPFQAIRLWTNFLTPRLIGVTGSVPQPRMCNATAAITHTRFGLIPVRSPLLGESRLISLPEVT